MKRSGSSRRQAAGEMAGMAGDGIRGVDGEALAIMVMAGGGATMEATTTAAGTGAGIAAGMEATGTAAGMAVGIMAGTGTAAGTGGDPRRARLNSAA